VSQPSVARRYARAVFDLGKESGELDAIVTGLRAFAQAYRSSDELRALDRLPGLSETERAAAIGELGARLAVPALVTRTVTMLAEGQRLGVLEDLVAQLGALNDEHQGIVRARIRTARPLSPDFMSRLRQKIADATGKTVVLEAEEDRSLIAGIVAQIGDRVIDGSVRGRLDRLAESLRQP
jgi:F-type H+-transporting ATPase subunit delta